MITLERLQEVFESKNSFFLKEEGKHQIERKDENSFYINLIDNNNYKV